jgi:hypothetical protein
MRNVKRLLTLCTVVRTSSAGAQMINACERTFPQELDNVGLSRLRRQGAGSRALSVRVNGKGDQGPCRWRISTPRRSHLLRASRLSVMTVLPERTFSLLTLCVRIPRSAKKGPRITVRNERLRLPNPRSLISPDAIRILHHHHIDR